MSNYTKTTDFTAKDGLTTGNPAKLIKGADFDVEFNAIATAVSSKIDTSSAQSQIDAKAPLASPTFTGTVTMTGATAVNVPAPSSGTNAATKTYVDSVAGGAAPLGVWLFIKELSATTTTVDFVHGTGGVVLDSTYDEYMFVLHKLLPSTDAVKLFMRYSTDTGSTYRTTSYYDYANDVNFGGTVISVSGTGTDYWPITSTHGSMNVGNVAANEVGVTGEVFLYKPSAASRIVVRSSVGFVTSTPAVASTRMYGQSTAAEDVDAIRFLWSSGNFTSGTIRLYGRKK